MYKEDLSLNNQQCHQTQTNKPNQYAMLQYAIVQ